MIRIALDQLSLSGPGSDRGLGRYANTIAVAARSLPEVGITEVRGRARDDGRDLFTIQRELRKIVSEIDVYHATSVHHLPLVKNTRWLCSIQDTIPLDLREYSRLGVKTRLLFRNARQADVILANSMFTAERVAATMRMPANRIAVCSLPVSSEYFHPKPPAPDASDRVDGKKYVVTMVDMRTPDPRKRFHWISDVAAALSKIGVDTVVVGRGTDRLVTATPVLRRENLSDAHLADIYSRAIGFFYPSAYEGQGMPPLEAMAAGCPVLAFRNSAVAEMVAQPNFLLDDPSPWQNAPLDTPISRDTLDEIVRRVSRWVSGETLSLARAEAREAAQRFDGREFRAQLAEAYAPFGES